jgi:co-chaperonin GroES (HSP10)
VEKCLIKPYGNRVLVELIKDAKTTPSGIVLPENAQPKGPIKGRVLAVGDGIPLLNLGNNQVPHTKFPCRSAVGDLVLIDRRHCGIDFKIENDNGEAVEQILLYEDGILAKIEE